MLNCKQKNKHLEKFPDHKEYLLTSTLYASEQKILELAQGYNKLIKKADGEEYMYSPFTKLIMPLMAEENASEIKPKAQELSRKTPQKRTSGDIASATPESILHQKPTIDDEHQYFQQKRQKLDEFPAVETPPSIDISTLSKQFVSKESYDQLKRDHDAVKERFNELYSKFEALEKELVTNQGNNYTANFEKTEKDISKFAESKQGPQDDQQPVASHGNRQISIESIHINRGVGHGRGRGFPDKNRMAQKQQQSSAPIL